MHELRIWDFRFRAIGCCSGSVQVFGLQMLNLSKGYMSTNSECLLILSKWGSFFDGGM